MATSRDYYEIEHSRSMCIDHPINMKVEVGDALGNTKTIEFEVGQKIILDEEAGATYPTYYIPENRPDIVFGTCTYIIDKKPEFADKTVKEVYFQSLFTDGRGAVTVRTRPSNSFVDTKQIIIYTDNLLDESIKERIYRYGDERGLFIQIRDANYVEARAKMDKPIAFISHDSRDKEDIARPLATELTRQLLRPVWFDEFSLKVGDSLRESIERGIKECKKCVLILTPNFFSNSGWTKKEFDSVFTREIIEKANVVLPVWANVKVVDVYNYSPGLADKVGVQWSEGVEVVAQKLKTSILRGE